MMLFQYFREFLALLILTNTALLLLLLYTKGGAQFSFETAPSVDNADNNQQPTIHSKCSARATFRGPNQRIVSYSLYGNIDTRSRYFKGIMRNAAIVGEFYPGWVMRVYHDVPADSSSAVWRHLTQLRRQMQHVDLCFAGDIPGLGDIRGWQQNAWRFLPLADPLVDVFLSRDIDALPSLREVAAVREWLDSGLTFHVMRDHFAHSVPIMGGMWGARLDLKRTELQELTELITKERAMDKGHDQVLLNLYLWPRIKGDVLQHDAYHCDAFRDHGNMRPFPVRRDERNRYNFVGNRLRVDTGQTLLECPEVCRPPDHQDWIYC